MDKSIRDYKFIHFEPRSHSKAKELVKKYPINRDYVCMSYIRGDTNDKTGGHLWNWTTLMSADELLIKNKLPEKGFNGVDCNGDKNIGINLIKWVNTDLPQNHSIATVHTASLWGISATISSMPLTSTLKTVDSAWTI